MAGFSDINFRGIYGVLIAAVIFIVIISFSLYYISLYMDSEYKDGYIEMRESSDIINFTISDLEDSDKSLATVELTGPVNDSVHVYRNRNEIRVGSNNYPLIVEGDVVEFKVGKSDRVTVRKGTIFSKILGRYRVRPDSKN